MPDLYFNSEVGFVEDSSSGLSAILATASAYMDFSRKQKSIASTADGPSITLFKKGDIGYALKDCIPLLNDRPEDRNLLLYLLQGFRMGSRIEVEEIDAECEDWVLENIDCASPLLEYAARRNGIALTVATTDDWKRDVFYFINKKEILPNIWGQNNLAFVLICYENSLISGKQYYRLLWEFYECYLDKKVIQQNNLSENEWLLFITLLKRARELQFHPTQSTYPLKSLGENTKYGMLFELKHKTGLRFFIVVRGMQSYICGYYKKGMAIEQSAAIKNAVEHLEHAAWPFI
ncbi:MAG: hypothetical protein LBB66_10355 [Desulfovibrio sp.]|jgi:hypothetical protein|nr:hypothetical protein [Desulfovibrio sp.]